MTITFDECLKKGMIKPFPLDPENVERELAGSINDLMDARENFEKGKYLWATVQSYYSMFHAARAVLYNEGYREKSHQCIEAFLVRLANDGRLDRRFVDYYTAIRQLRESANYTLTFSEDNAAFSMKNASEFNEKMKFLIEHEP
jgi:uncharacterized protein (UPF0332 family)